MTSRIHYIKQYVRRVGCYKIQHELNGISIRVISNDKNAINWTSYCHLGYFAKCYSDLPQIEIWGAYVDYNFFSCIIRAFNFTEEIEMFFGHKGFIEEINGYKIYYDSNSKYIHIKENEDHYIVVLYVNDDSYRILGRIERELFFGMNCHEHFRIHGGSIYDSKLGGMLIAGEKGVGKSTLLLGALLHGVQFGSNDRTEIYRKNQMINYCGVPTSIRLCEEQINYIENVTARQLKQLSFCDLGILKGKYEYSPQEIREYFNANIVNNRPLRYVLIPHFSRNKICVTEINNRERALRVIEKNIIVHDKAFARYFLDDEKKIIHREILQELISSTLFFKVDGWLYDFDTKMLV